MEQAQHRGPALPPPEASRDVRRAEVRRGDRPAVRRACCPEPASPWAQVSWSAWVSPSEREWLPALASPGGPQVHRLKGPWASPSAQAWAAPRAPLQEAAEVLELGARQREAVLAASAVPQAGPEAAASGHAAAGPRPEAVLSVLEPAVSRAAPEAAVSERAAAGPQPEAVQQVSVRQAAGVAAAEPGGPQGAAAEAALQGAAVRLPAAAQRAGGAVQRRVVAVQPDAGAQQAARPRAGPSAAASVFRQGRSLATEPAGPARPRAAKRSAHAMRCWPIASR
ncbi:hypothetical protein GGD63_007521 [Bradyrhizobium sp. cir1]|nr:hypothetical protein [Bradyrhizobium sp. cir1]